MPKHRTPAETAAADLRQAELDGRYCMGWMAGYEAAQDKAKGKAA